MLRRAHRAVDNNGRRLQLPRSGTQTLLPRHLCGTRRHRHPALAACGRTARRGGIRRYGGIGRQPDTHRRQQQQTQHEHRTEPAHHPRRHQSHRAPAHTAAPHRRQHGCGTTGQRHLRSGRQPRRPSVGRHTAPPSRQERHGMEPLRHPHGSTARAARSRMRGQTALCMGRLPRRFRQQHSTHRRRMHRPPHTQEHTAARPHRPFGQPADTLEARHGHTTA